MASASYTHNDETQPTRAELKRRMDRLQDLGKRLTELPSGKLVRLDLPEKLRDAVLEAQRLTSMGAKRRQLQYIGRIMEEFDAASIARGLRDIDLPLSKSTVQTAKSPGMLMAEALITGGDEVLHADYADKLSHSDIQQIRLSLRQSAKAIAAGKDPGNEALKLAKICSHFIGG